MQLDPKQILASKPRYFRAPISRGAAPRVDREGGYFEAGLIRGVSVITQGEALGHGQWIDAEMVAQVNQALLNAADGIKSRFTHPGLSSDGLGKYTGRIMEARLSEDGTQVLGNQHFAQSAHATPDGDLANYLMTLAEEDPSAYGLSIVYEADEDAERAHFVEHGGQIVDDPEMGEFWDNTHFRSPDPLNAHNFPHARLGELRAADSVDEPAANPNGLFHRGENLIQEADLLACFALGLSGQRPQIVQLGLDADRVRGFVTRFLANHKLEIRSMSDAEQLGEGDQVITTTSTTVTETVIGTGDEDETESPAVDESATTEESSSESSQAGSERAQAAQFRAEFGDRGLVWFADGLSIEEARKREVQELRQQVAELTKKAAAKHIAGEDSPIGFNAADEQKSTRRGFASKYRIRSK